jgi:hypothetical protein
MLANTILILSAPGQYVFRMSSTLTLASGVKVDVSALDATSGVYWLAPDPTTAVTLGVDAAFAGNILTNGSIVFDMGAQDGCGRALSQNKLVSFAGADPATIDGRPNLVGGGCSGALADSGGLNGGGPGPGPVPEPGTFALLSAGLAIGLLMLRKLR